ncbi:hypothetical protein F511_18394 [Dorcoceras hygrometricum]|uniref:Phosphoglycerate mutase family protein n=1 Tax=Dorcoceras hygrometricum TaxID=472368 RepID=A0A2Z7CCH3_9LAMI|nr:hypothetical protein F511_18394 [Dorcoceras hygrometricum]
MGSSQSTPPHLPSDDEQQPQHQEEDEEEEEEDEDEDEEDARTRGTHIDHEALVKKILQQEPEMLPFHTSASPLSPQLSTHSTPRLAPSIKVWDPYNVLAPRPPPHHSNIHRSDLATDVYLICHGECHMTLRPDLVAGRCPDAALTPNGKRQARALAVFLKSQGVRFNAVYTSPLDRVRATALSVCQELNFSEDQIQPSDALVEMSQGHWEGCQKSEVFTPDMVSLMERTQPDFSAPSGESLRQVEFRMVQFLNGRITSFPDYKFRSDFSQPDRNIDSHDPTHWESLQHRHRQVGFPRKKSAKSRLQIVSSSGDHEADDEMSPREPPLNQGVLIGDLSHVRTTSTSSSMSTNMCTRYSCIGIFSHAIPIKCLLMGVLGCSPAMMDKICIDDSSVTVLQHSWKLGWQIKRLNDTSHLRLL